VTVQLELPGVITELGLHTNELTPSGGRTVTVPPLPVTETGLPDGEAPRAFVTEIAVLVVTVGDSVTLTVAATPSPRTVLFMPASRHMYVPVPCTQATDLFAAVAADPGATVMAVTSEGE